MLLIVEKKSSLQTFTSSPLHKKAKSENASSPLDFSKFSLSMLDLVQYLEF